MHVALANPVTYYASYTLHVPLTMNVRIVQTSPSGIQKEAYSGDVEADKKLLLELTGSEKGTYRIDVYYDGELSFTESAEFK